jgi:multidrug efflux pump subunit AcrA (membrane-fusion protein)
MRFLPVRFRPLFLIGGMLLNVLALGCAKPNKGPEVPPAAPVTWEPPAELMLEEWTEVLGTTQPLPNQVARLSAPVEGRVASILQTEDGKPVHEGEQVKQGTVVVQLDDTIVKSNLAKLEAALKFAEEEESQADYVLQLAQSEVERLKKLRQDEDERRSKARPNDSPLGVVSLVTSVDWEKANVALLDAQSKRRGAKQRKEAAHNERAAQHELLKLHRLRTPISGQLGRIQVVQGQTIAVGTPVVDIVNLQPQIDVLCFVPSSVAAKLRLGQATRLGGIDQTPATAAPTGPAGRVEFIADQAEPETGNFAVKVRFPNETVRLRANTVLRLRIRTRDGEPCLAVHESALLEDQDPPAVIISTPVEFTDVETKDLPKPVSDKLKEQFPSASIKKAGMNTTWGMYKVSLAGVDDDVLIDPKGSIVKDKIGEARRLQATIGIRDRVKGMVQIRRLDDPEKKWHGKIDDALFITNNGQGLQNGDRVKFPAEEDEAPPPEK